MKVGDCMNVWRALDCDDQWTDKVWYDREFEDGVASIVHRDIDDVRRVAVIRIKSLKEPAA